MNISEIVALAKIEAEKHGFFVPIRIDNSKHRLAGCAHIGSIVTFLTFSSVLMPLVSDAEVLDTILHEIAHAKTPGENHGRKWKLAAVSIGARPEPRPMAEIDAKQADFKYIAPCACSLTKHGKCRRPTRRAMCKECRRPLVYVQQY